MTDERLAELERLAAAASPGPWLYERLTWRGGFRTAGKALIIGEWWNDAIGAEDAAFIAAARSAVPALVARVRELEAAVAAERVRCAGVARDFARDAAAANGQEGPPLWGPNLERFADDIAAAIEGRP